jgi:hypothetical protein
MRLRNDTTLFGIVMPLLGASCVACYFVLSFQCSTIYGTVSCDRSFRIPGDFPTIQIAIDRIECDGFTLICDDIPDSTIVDILNRSFTIVGTEALSEKGDRLSVELDRSVCKFKNIYTSYLRLQGSKAEIESCTVDYLLAYDSHISITGSILLALPNVRGSYLHLKNNACELSCKRDKNCSDASMSFILLEGNTIQSTSDRPTGNACEYTNGTYVVARDNVFFGFQNALLFEYDSRGVIYNNTFVDNSTGIALSQHINLCVVMNNIFTTIIDSVQGMAVVADYCCPSFNGTSTLWMGHNLFYFPNYRQDTIDNPYLLLRGYDFLLHDLGGNQYADPLLSGRPEYIPQPLSPAIGAGADSIPCFSITETMPYEDVILSDYLLRMTISQPPDIGAQR